MIINAFKYSDIGGRRVNEDTVGFLESGTHLVAVVTDGLGGQGDGNLASQCVCNSLMHCGSEGHFPSEEEIAVAFERANQELISKQQNDFHMKTTAVYLCISGNRAVWAHVGDSRLYHIFNGQLCHYTLDHSASQMAVYMGKITRDEIPNDAGRSRLLRAMGVREERPDIHEPIILEPGKHAFLLCSDGLWEYLSDEEIIKAYSNAETVQRFVGILTLVKNSRSPQDCDNNSAVAVFVEI